MIALHKKYGKKPKFGSPKRIANYRLSKLADQDLGNIASYAIQRFGIRQANLYRDGLFKALEMISDFPLIGSDQSQIKKNIRRHVHESHSIYYHVDADEIFILRILGPGEDPLQQLNL